MHTLKALIISPGDVEIERTEAERVIAETNKVISASLDLYIKTFNWRVDATPGFHARGPQELIDELAGIDDSDIVVAIFWKRLGKLVLNENRTGTEHEFHKAYECWKRNTRPQMMSYFSRAPAYTSSIEDADQIKALLEFKNRFPDEGLWCDYDGPAAFPELFRGHLGAMIGLINRRRLLRSPLHTHRIPEPIRNLDEGQISLLAIDQDGAFSNLQSSFWTDGKHDEFRRLRLQTTSGIVDGKQGENWIYIVRDPIRPFEIQIGEMRSKRPGGDPGLIALSGGMSVESFRHMYPFIVDESHKWLRMVLAELETDQGILEHIWREDPDPEVQRVVARNPSAPDQVKEAGCLFCKPEFLRAREIAASGNARIIHNDYPYGPYFHYIVLPHDPVHSWENVQLRHLRDMNVAIGEMLSQHDIAGRSRLRGSAGLRVGLNSTIRHLILGSTSRSSAGASVAHVHKQVWGMAPGSLNLADHLAHICGAYSRRNIDYLDRYLGFLNRHKLVIWEDDNLALYVPLGQSSIHELQAMIKRRDTNHYLELNRAEVVSLSNAEFIVSRLYRAMGINSFNEIVLSRPFADQESIGFRVIVTFITREIDLAVSELSLLYVVDRHFGDTLELVRQHMPAIEKEVSAQMEAPRAPAA